ncbi:MAG: ATP-grasp domain-containing protein [Bacillota bacterium]
MIGVDRNPNAVGKFFVEVFYNVPDAYSQKYIDSLLDICLNENVNVVLPQTTKEIEVLSKHLKMFKDKNIRIGVSPYKAIRVANNKALLLNMFKDLGLPCPKFRVVQSARELVAIVEEFGYPENPVVVKPPLSNGMRGFRILMEDYWDVRKFLEEKPDGVVISLGDLRKILEKGEVWPTLLVMEYLPGKEYTVDAFQGEKTFVAIPRVRQAIRSGISFAAVIEQREDLVYQTRKASEALGLRFSFGFQYKEDAEGVPKVLECNPRIQGTMVASSLAGVNLIWFSVRELLGQPVEPEYIASKLNALKGKRTAFYRYWGGVGVIDDMVTGII